MPDTFTYRELVQRAVQSAELSDSFQISPDRAQVYAKVAEVYARLAHTEADRELRNRGQ